LSRVRRLPDEVVDQIKAGEVVERPASVVKELIENALDAGARRIAVEIEAGGKSRIRVRDDGSGMSREDAELALERHATSKLTQVDDLRSIATRGFRGEALPAIASVSHLWLRTRAESDAGGTEVEVDHGRALGVRDVGHPRGTTVDVADLFGSVPVRRKFLRTEATEAAHVAEMVTLMALPRPEVGFSLRAGSRVSVDAPAVTDLESRVYQLFGDAFLEGLVPVEAELDWVRVRGYVARPDRAGRRPVLRLFVNERPIRDRGLTRALAEGYRSAGVGDRRPEGLVLLDIPSDLVDVNVHPTKSEVRFADARTVWVALERAVRESVSRESRRIAPAADLSRVEEAVSTYLATPPSAGARESGPPSLSAARGSVAGPERVDEAIPDEGGGTTERELFVLGQHRATYIVVSDGEDLLLVDQHTAHERVRFERLMRGAEERRVPSQGLLTPAVVTLPPRLQPVAEANAAELAALGFDSEPFGGGALRVRAVPELLGTKDPGPAILHLLEELLERESSSWAVSTARERLAATLACHSSVRGGQPLATGQMEAIVRDLERAEHPSLCPHGRPTRVRIPRSEVSRWFGRSGWRRQ